MHFCDNKGVAAIMAKGSAKDYLHNLAREIYVTTRNASVNLLVVWKRRCEEEMVREDLGLLGPWLVAEDFQLDFNSYSWVFSKYFFTCDAMASFKNKMCVKYYSAA